jgi:hypothetical protein
MVAVTAYAADLETKSAIERSEPTLGVKQDWRASWRLPTGVPSFHLASAGEDYSR